MKNIILVIGLMLPAISWAKTVVDDSRAESDAIVAVYISGAQAAKLYNAMTAVEEQSDCSMGGKCGLSKQAKGIDCSISPKWEYSCTLKVSTAGLSLEPWK